MWLIRAFLCWIGCFSGCWVGSPSTLTNFISHPPAACVRGMSSRLQGHDKSASIAAMHVFGAWSTEGCNRPRCYSSSFRRPFNLSLHRCGLVAASHYRGVVESWFYHARGVMVGHCLAGHSLTVWRFLWRYPGIPIIVCFPDQKHSFLAKSYEPDTQTPNVIERVSRENFTPFVITQFNYWNIVSIKYDIKENIVI